MINSGIFIGYLTILRKETVRIFRIWTQTILPSVVTQGLHLMVFGGLMGSMIGRVGQVDYATFLIPGLIMMAAITNSFSNTAGSFFIAKFQRSIEEILVSPMKSWVILAGYVSGGVVRGVVVSVAVFGLSLFFSDLNLFNILALIFFLVITCVIFSLLGFMNGLVARNFDEIGLIPTFILTPLTYLGGVFYNIEVLPPFWRNLSTLNPIVYMIDGFRFGFSGLSSTPVVFSALVLLLVAIALALLCLDLLERGVGLRN